MSGEIAERVVSRFAQLSKGQKEEAVKKVMTNLEAKKKDKGKSKADKKKKSKPKPKKDKAKPKKDKKEVEEVEAKEEVEEVKDEKPDENPEEAPKDDTSEMSDESSDDSLMKSIESLSEELERVKQDGKVDSGEVVDLFNNMMNMVTNLLQAKPGRKPKTANRVACVFLLEAARGLQVKRKDKDLMQDTGGTSKVREREPEQKPPREDMKKPHRTKDKPAPERDTDTDNDKDLKKGSVAERVARRFDTEGR